jgi:hypothetical protein
MRYETNWRNKWLTTNARTIGEMANALQAAADVLREMQAHGITLDAGSDVAGDYAALVTHDPAVADRFGLEPEEERRTHPLGAGARLCPCDGRGQPQ